MHMAVSEPWVHSEAREHNISSGWRRSNVLKRLELFLLILFSTNWLVFALVHSSIPLEQGGCANFGFKPSYQLFSQLVPISSRVLEPNKSLGLIAS